MRSIKELKNKHEGRPVAVLGGGPNLPEDLRKVPDNSVLIGINYHAEILVRVDYMCFVDSPKHFPGMNTWVKIFTGRRLTFIDGFSDWKVDIPYLYFGKTFPFAVWAALFISSGPVILCGMDCYTNGNHFHDPVEKFKFHDLKMENILIWQRVKSSVIEPERIRAVSGPLVHLFGEFNAG